MRVKLILSILVVCGTLISCGGDDDNGVKPDTTPPTVVSTIPVLGATDVHPSTPISATFSEAVQSATITGTTFTIVGNPPGTITYTNRVATFTPDSPLTPGATYYVGLTTGIKDLAGNALAANYVWSFTVADVFLTNGPDYFRMAEGDTWYYTDEYSQSIVRTVSGDTTINSTTCARILDNGVTAEAWTIDSAGFYVHLLDRILRFDPPLGIPFDLAFDQPYDYNTTVYWIENDTLWSSNISGTLKFKGYVTYDTPTTGIHFDDVIKFFYIPDGYYEYYGRGVGLLDNGNYVLDSAFVGGVWYR